MNLINIYIRFINFPLELTAANIGMLNFYISRVLQMNTIGIWTTFRWKDCNVVNIDSTWTVEFKVALRAVYDFDVANCHIEAWVEP